MNSENKNRLIIKISIITAVLFALFAFIAPILFTQLSIFDLTEPNNSIIADTIYGLSGPFIAIGAAILTFVAFFIQKEANDIQIANAKTQKEKDDIESFENRLFKLIDAHRENINDLYFEGKNIDGTNIIFQGQKAISALTFTLSAIVLLVKKIQNIDNVFNKQEQQIFAYLVFAHGTSLASNKWFTTSDDFKHYSKQEMYINYLVDAIDDIIYKNLQPTDGNLYYLKQAMIKRQSSSLISIRRNLMNELSRYFRQIYQIYVYIDNQKFLTPDQKYAYAKLFRTNLTNQEQELIYNNIISPYGNVWRSKNFILNYKPFKNIASFGKYCFSPYDYLNEVFKLTKDELKNNLDVLTFDNETN